MSHLSNETILGMPAAEIHKLALSAIRFNYDHKRVVKLSSHEMHNIAWDLVTSIYEKQGQDLSHAAHRLTTLTPTLATRSNLSRTPTTT